MKEAEVKEAKTRAPLFFDQKNLVRCGKNNPEFSDENDCGVVPRIPTHHKTNILGMITSTS